MLGSSRCIYDMANNNQIRKRYSALKCLLIELDCVVIGENGYEQSDRRDT